jgi:hypothetical protein
MCLHHLRITATPLTAPHDASWFGSKPRPAVRPKFPAGVLLHLARLTHLHVGGFAVTAAALEHLTRLSGLQHLHFGNLSVEEDAAGEWYDDGVGEDWLCTLPATALAALSGLQHLTSLRLSGAECALGSSSTPGFSTLTALRSLELRDGAGLQPSVLSNMTELQKLVLQATGLRGSSMQGLLDVLPQLQQLTELCLFDAMRDTTPAAQYSALVSSSKLEKLDLSCCFLPGTWYVMFDGRRQLPALRTVRFYDESCLFDVANSGVRAQDLRSLALSCPGLQELDVSMDPAADVSVLQPLQHLTRLFTSNMLVSTEAAAGLTRLASLKLLQVHNTDCRVLVFADEEGLSYLTAVGQNLGPHIFFNSEVSEARGVGGVFNTSSLPLGSEEAGRIGRDARVLAVRPGVCRAHVGLVSGR